MAEALTPAALLQNPTLVVLCALSVLACTLGLEKGLALGVFVRRQRRALASLLAHLTAGTPQSAAALNDSLPAHRATPLFATLLAEPAQGASPALRRAHLRLAAWARRRLWVLGSIAAIAPFVGLFGTVLGIMRAFAAVAADHAGGLEVVSAGVSEALVTTAAGILVAIEAVCLFNWLQVLAQTAVASNQEALELLVEHLPPPPPAAP